MLDVGGAFYSKAFEMSGYDVSTYGDLGIEACSLTKQKVGLKNVLNQNAAMLNSGGHQYDYIMCRYLIEHLVNPTAFILKLTEVLEDGGTLLVICSNGDSLEYFVYPYLDLKDRVKKVSIASELSSSRVKLKLLTGEISHGIDPPRHLWAIFRKEVRQFHNDSRIYAEIATLPLTDPVYSPYFSSKTLAQKVWFFLGDMVIEKNAGGTHLSVVIRNSLRPRIQHAA